jgi:hypothetical protein
MNPRERGDDVMPEQSCSEPIGHDAPALNNVRETGNPSDVIRVGDPNQQSAWQQKVTEKMGANVPTLCAYCSGIGWRVEGFAGEPSICTMCYGDGIERRP